MDLPTFDLRLLPSYLAVAEELHFGRAAERLRLSQPALSRQVARLEEQLGTPLLLRSSRTVELTAAGVLVRDAARDIVAGSARARSAARAGHDELVVAFDGAADPLATRTLTSFSAAHPELAVRVVELPMTASSLAVLNGSADIAFDLAGAVPDGLSWTFLERLPVGIACAAGDPLVRGPTVSWAGLEGARLYVAPPGVADGHNAFLRDQLRHVGVRCQEVVGPLNRPALLCGHIAAGLGFLVCCEEVLGPRPADVAWLPLTPAAHLEVGLVRHPERPVRTADMFVDWACTQVGVRSGEPLGR